MKIVAWNAKVGRTDAAVKKSLGQIIDDHHPAVICLQEAKGYVDVARSVGGYHTYAHGDWAESNDNFVMVRDNYDKKERGNGWNTLRCTTRWEGPHGQPHAGRTWTWVLVDGIYVMSYHRVTGGKAKNRSAFKEEYNRTVEFINARRASAFVVFGDHNIGPKEDTQFGSKQIASAVSGSCRFDPRDPGIDYAICRNQQGEVKRTKLYGSDHKMVLFTTK